MLYYVDAVYLIWWELQPWLQKTDNSTDINISGKWYMNVNWFVYSGNEIDINVQSTAELYLIIVKVQFGTRKYL
jgi:hypothetical protein